MKKLPPEGIFSLVARGLLTSGIRGWRICNAYDAAARSGEN
jgi:hypothetical protein